MEVRIRQLDSVETSHSHELLLYAKRLQALAQAGLAYGSNPFDRERYEEIRTISAGILAELMEKPVEKILKAFVCEDGYQTPKQEKVASLDLSADRVTRSQLNTVFDLAQDPASAVLCD